MPWTIAYLQQQQVVRIETHGRMDIAAIKAMITDAIAEADRHGVASFLVDHRDMIPDLPVSDLYYLVSDIEQLGANRQQKVAILWQPGPEQQSAMEFYQDRTYNAGFSHRLFTDEREALAWLTE
jgi:hypothetical protein